jgi:hypothetical protein
VYGLVGDTRTLPARTPFALAMSDLRPRRIRLDADTPWLSADPESARLIRAIGAHSLIVAPTGEEDDWHYRSEAFHDEAGGVL